MQFTFFISKSVPVNENGLSVIEGCQRRNPQLDELLNVMGEASAKSQGLKQVITNSMRFYQTDQKVYMKSEGKQCLGILKVGKKNLFHRDYNGQIKEIKPTCVLDFYVHESVQRRGIGKELFEAMLAGEGLKAERLAYDRPSSKLLAFLKKHYKLQNFIPQNNNFVIYNQYFEAPNLSQSKAQNIDQIDKMMQEMSLHKQQQQQQQQQQHQNQYQLVSPWAIDNKLVNNQIYQTTTSQMSAQIYKR